MNIRFLLTGYCNSYCFFCHRDGSGRDGLMDYDLFKSVLKRYEPIEKIRFAGGEPLLHPQLFDMISDALCFTNNIGIVSNGLLLNKYIKEVKTSKLPKANISLHTVNENTYSKITGLSGDKLRGVKASIEKIRNDISIKINCVILNGLNTEIKELESLINYCVNNEFSLEFIELDKGISEEVLKKYHLSARQFSENVKELGIRLDYNEDESLFYNTNYKLGIHIAHCINDLCVKCANARPLLVYPSGKVNKCRMS